MTTTTTEPVRFTEAERLLALNVAFLEQRISVLQYGLGVALKAVRPNVDPELWEFCYGGIYHDMRDDDGTVIEPNCQAPVEPVPSHWLQEMGQTGRTLAQVAGSRSRAEQLLESLEAGGWMHRDRSRD